MSDTTGRTLLLMRHAEAESFAAEDHARRLTEAGRRAAADVGRWLATTAPTVDLALVSSAARAQETYAGVAEGAGLDLVPQIEDALYAAGEDSALESLRTVDPGARTVLWIGHNPTVSMLAHSLSDEDPDLDAFAALTGGFPPASVAVLSVPVAWADLAAELCGLRAFHEGRG